MTIPSARIRAAAACIVAAATIDGIAEINRAHAADGALPARTAQHSKTTESLAGTLPASDIDITADDMKASGSGDIVAEGDVEVRHGERIMRTPTVRYRQESGVVSVPGHVELQDPKLRLRGKSAESNAQGDAEFTGAQFEIPDRDGRGSADRILLTGAGELDLRGVRYTTCPNPDTANGNPDWELVVARLRIDARAQEGSATGARVEIKGIPIFYTPYISFPVGNERKTGLLFPSGGDSSRGGFTLAMPWYWNIAPNYDATVTPTWYSARGIDMGAKFRFLTQRHRGILNGDYLPDDQSTQNDRHYFTAQTQSDFTDRLRLDLDAANISDTAYFEDFGDSTMNSTTVLPRTMRLQYRSANWLLGARAQNYQIVDREIPLADRPYTVLPQFVAQGYFPDRWLGATGVLDAEFIAFEHNNQGLAQGLTGQRLDVRPELRLPLRGNSVYLEPAIAWRYTTYRLADEHAPLADDSPSRSAPIFSLDSGVVFERSTGKGQRVQTLEPRLLYLYVPYRNQDALPIFDTARPDLNLTQLFSNNRYVGADRLGDANQLAYGVTSRLLSATDGGQYLSATLGQTVRYSTPRVTLPGETPGSYDRSDVIGELALTAYRHWSAQAGLQWNPNQQRAERIEFNFQYLPESGKVVNMGYRFREPQGFITQGLEQAYASFAWPVRANVSAFGRLVYSLQDSTATEQFAGIEYRSCCWSMRLVAGRTIATRAGDYDTWYRWQFELKGLSSVGSAGAFLEQSIPGYSAARFDAANSPAP